MIRSTIAQLVCLTSKTNENMLTTRPCEANACSFIRKPDPGIAVRILSALVGLRERPLPPPRTLIIQGISEIVNSSNPKTEYPTGGVGRGEARRGTASYGGARRIGAERGAARWGEAGQRLGGAVHPGHDLSFSTSKQLR